MFLNWLEHKAIIIALIILKIIFLVGNSNAPKLVIPCDILAGKSSQFPGLREGGGGGRICLQN